MTSTTYGWGAPVHAPEAWAPEGSSANTTSTPRSCTPGQGYLGLGLGLWARVKVRARVRVRVPVPKELHA